MASFVIHHIAGVNFLSILENRYGITLTESEKNKFLLGNLIVDSSRIKKVFPKNATKEELRELKKKYRILAQEEKIATHFRDSNDLELCIQAPKLSSFINKYQDLFKEDLSVLGYFYHLYTDKMFFEDLFKESFDCLDKDGISTIYVKDVRIVKVHKNDKIYSVQDFWDGSNKESIYYDYTVMNRILLEYYGSNFNKNGLLETSKSFMNPGIEEVDYSNIISVIDKTSLFIEESYQTNSSHLNIFDEEIVKNFINVVANKFIDEHTDLVELACASYKNKRLKK